MQLARAAEQDGNYRKASTLRGIAIQAGNLRDFETLIP
jgi:hypothetical protein